MEGHHHPLQPACPIAWVDADGYAVEEGGGAQQEVEHPGVAMGI